MKRLIALVPLVAMPTALIILGVADSAASIADTPILSSEALSRGNEAGNPDSANVTITITTKTPPLPEE